VVRAITFLPPLREDVCVPKTVLVVDDEELYRDLLKDHLETLGIQVLQAEDPTAGLELLRGDSTHVDLVLLDGTPGGDRRKAFVDLQAERPGLPVVVMSGELWEGLEPHFRGLPVAGYLGKPFSMGRILEILEVVAHR
jgi:DNA-binding response OmpR family regulator